MLEVFVRSPIRAPVQGCTPIFTLLNIREPLAWNGGDAPSDLPGQVDPQFRCERLALTAISANSPSMTLLMVLLGSMPHAVASPCSNSLKRSTRSQTNEYNVHRTKRPAPKGRARAVQSQVHRVTSPSTPLQTEMQSTYFPLRKQHKIQRPQHMESKAFQS